MGILNVTPDSFSDGGHYSDPDRAYARALEMEEQGADIIDIGAESTRPDSSRISAEEEWRRLVPVLKLLKDKLTVPISLDTYKSEIAERALQYGVQIFNDPSGLTFDPALAKTAADANAGLILNHMRGLPESWSKLPAMPDVLGTIGKDLEATTSRARRAGVDRTRIVVDPGLGFGKRKEQNSEILGQLARLAELGYPILVGPSRKSFLSQASDNDTLHATAAAVTAAILNGAHIVRVHDIKENRIVAQVADEIGRLSAHVSGAEEERNEKPAPRKRVEGPRFGEEERPRPTRPPLARPVLRTPIEANAPPPPSSPAPPREWKREDRPPQPRGPRDDKPPFRGQFGDRPPPRGGFRPERGGPAKGPWRDRPPQGGPGSDRPRNDRPRDDRPRDDRSRDDRPRNDGYRNDRPRDDRPRNDKPSFGRPPQDRPPQGRPPMGARPGARPPRSDDSGRPPHGRPPQGGPPKRPFRKRP